MNNFAVFNFDNGTLNNTLVIAKNAETIGDWWLNNSIKNRPDIACYLDGDNIACYYARDVFKRKLSIDSFFEPNSSFSLSVNPDLLEKITGIHVGVLPFAPLKIQLGLKRSFEKSNTKAKLTKFARKK